jgi:hypothetical protein
VHVGFQSVFGPCKTLVPDPQAPPQGQLVSQWTCLGKGRRMVERKVGGLGLYVGGWAGGRVGGFG